MTSLFLPMKRPPAGVTEVSPASCASRRAKRAEGGESVNAGVRSIVIT